MTEYWIGFEAGLQYAKRAADARRSDEELKALLAAKKRQELMDRAAKLAKAQAATDAHVKRCQGWDPATFRANTDLYAVQPTGRRIVRVWAHDGHAGGGLYPRDCSPFARDCYPYAPPKAVAEREPRRVSLSHWGLYAL